MASHKQDIITFKVERSALKMLKGIRNRSEFIRNAILAAAGNLCPLCRGSGILTPPKKKHWDEFSKQHAVEECEDCHDLIIVCKNE